MLPNSPKISVIVPVYKAEAYLHRCVDSLLAQTFQDFEVLLIDDGSPDRSGEICDEYARKDSRVRVFYKENGGVSSARNLGLDHVKGEWICFVDSDDYVDRTYIDDLLSAININYEKELVVQGYKITTPAGAIVDEKLFESGVVLRDSFIELFSAYNLCSFGFPWSKLFLGEIIRNFNIRFETSVSYSEDLLFVFDYVCHVEKVVFLENTSYFYVDNLNSLTKKVSNFSIENNGFHLFLDRMKAISVHCGIPNEHLLISSKDALSVFLYRILTSIYNRKLVSVVSSVRLLKQIYKDYAGLLPISTSGGMILICILKMLRLRCFFMVDLTMRLYMFLYPIKRIVMHYFK